jgi:hypothetical protein
MLATVFGYEQQPMLEKTAAAFQSYGAQREMASSWACLVRHCYQLEKMEQVFTRMRPEKLSCGAGDPKM